jgi:hypothetical protein
MMTHCILLLTEIKLAKSYTHTRTHVLYLPEYEADLYIDEHPLPTIHTLQFSGGHIHRTCVTLCAIIRWPPVFQMMN